jgi:drug/metabolite transporter (DMT)-like permease
MKESHRYAMIAVASLIWGTMGILGKLAFEYGIHPATLIALRLLISSLTIAVPVALFKRRLLKIRKADLIHLLLLGIFATALQRVAYFYAVSLTTATMAAVLFYTYPIFVTAYSSLFCREKIGPQTAVAIVLTFTGVALVVRAYQTAWIGANVCGVLLGFLSSALFALYFLLTKKMRSSYTNWTLILYGDAIGAISLTPILFTSFPEIVSFPQQLWILIFAIAWFPSLLAYLFYSYALKHVQSSKGSILSVIEPLSAALFSASILAERFDLPQIIGVALALTGVALLFYKPKLKS